MVVINEMNAATKEPKPEETNSTDEEEDEEFDEGGDNKKDDGTSGKHSRNEKRSRKAFSKLSLTPVSNITKVVIKKSAAVSFAIEKPDVYSVPGSKSYVIFGEAKVQDYGASNYMEAAQKHTKSPQKAADPKDETSTETAADDGAEADATGVEEKDIELVIKQVGCSRNSAIKALKDNNNDLLDAIMQLSSSG